MKLSVIIPTMQKNTKVLLKLLENISNDDIVDEIILIDNSGKGFEKVILNINKVVQVINQENRFVNPTWNQGVELAKNDYWALLNDDILISNDFCTNVISKIKPSMGIVGVAENSVLTLNPEAINNISLKDNKDLKLIKTDERVSNFGIAMFGHKKSYYKIPKDLLIFCGDDYLFKMNQKHRKENYVISGIDVYHMHSLTSSSPKFSELLIKDMMTFDKYYRIKTIPFIKKIFFIKNLYYDYKKNKVLCLFGFKFLLKSKPVQFDINSMSWI